MSVSTIAFVTSYHSPYDDRIYYHLAKSTSGDRKVIVITGKEDIHVSGDIEIVGFNGSEFPKDAKIEKFQGILKEYKPGIVICSEPMPIIATNRYKKQSGEKVKILYDITEWYPSKKNLAYSNGFASFLLFIKLLVFNIFVSSKCDGFIFGEYYKSLPYRILFPWKKWMILGYNPNLGYINYQEACLTDSTIRIGFTGTVNSEKGIDYVFDSLHKLKAIRPQLKVILKVVGSFVHKADKDYFDMLVLKFEEIDVEFMDWQAFENFSNVLHDVDIFLDLRVTDFENQHCLPIKLFYYAACGRPTIYSNLKAIRRELDITSFGYLVDPTDTSKIANIISGYIDDTDLYYSHCNYARQISVDKYNWDKIKPAFLSFIHTFEHSR